MTAAYITFLGGAETGNVGETVWENTGTGQKLVLPIRVPVLVDPAARPKDKAFLEHVIKKARTNQFFEVEDAMGGAAVLEPPKPRGRPRKIHEDVTDVENAD